MGATVKETKIGSVSIVEPASDGVVLWKHGDHILVRCDCDGGMSCPQGRIGSGPRCQVWIKRSEATDELVERVKRENRFDR